MTNNTPGLTLSSGRLATLVASRFVLNSVFRIAYPLIPFVSARFAVAPEMATWIVTIAVLCGLMSPVGGWLGERTGYRTTMVLGMGLTLLGTLGAAITPSFELLVAAYGMCGIGIAVYQPAMHAYVSAVTSYGGRGRAIGMVELSWALSGIAAVPLLMRLVEAQSSVSGTFAILSAGLAVVTLATVWLLPVEAKQPHSQAQNGDVGAVLRSPSVHSLLAFIFLAMGGVEVFNIVQPLWVTDRFEASLSDLGTAAFIFGFGELIGSAASALLTDRLGKLRSAAIGFGLVAVVLCVLPLVSSTWTSYLICYLVLAVCVEFAIVASLTLASTVQVVGRATVMALTITVLQISRAIASRIGVPVLQSSSLLITSLLAASLTLLGVVIALRRVQETERHVVHDTA